MKPNDLRNFLSDKKIEFQEKDIQDGTQLRCEGGEVLSIYHKTNKLVIGGARTALAEEIQGKFGGIFASRPKELEQGAKPKAAEPIADRRVFIVYGHDTHSRDQLELLLRRMSLDPIVLQNLPAAGDTIIEKLEQYLVQHGKVGFACVLVTPDDEGYEQGKPDKKNYRARQNVVLELGMVLASLGRKRVAILIKESVEQPSDIAGLIYRRFKERVDEVKTELFKDLRAAGLEPNMDQL